MQMDTLAIVAAVSDLLEGAIGYRGVPAGTFVRGVFAGQPTGAQQALAMQARHRFDVDIPTTRDNASTYVGAFASKRIVDADVVIRVTTRVATTADAAARFTALRGIANDCDVAIKALRVPGNLEQDAAGNPTGICSGLMRGPGGAPAPVYRKASEDWRAQLVVSEITGLITIEVEANPE
jgi:hypothetical protein